MIKVIKKIVHTTVQFIHDLKSDKIGGFLLRTLLRTERMTSIILGSSKHLSNNLLAWHILRNILFTYFRSKHLMMRTQNFFFEHFSSSSTFQQVEYHWEFYVHVAHLSKFSNVTIPLIFFQRSIRSQLLYSHLFCCLSTITAFAFFEILYPTQSSVSFTIHLPSKRNP